MADTVKTAAIEFTANEAKFLASIKKLQQENKVLGSSFKTLAKDANAVFGGQLEQKAKLSAEAIRQVGDASKLTNGEVKQHLATLDAWIAKAQKLGREVAPQILSTREALAKADAEIQKTDRHTAALKQSFDQADKEAKELAATVRSLSGADLEKRAQQSAAAIRQVGGASKLTDAEVKQHLASIDAWIAKAGKVGKEVPPQILQTRAALMAVNTEGQKTPSIFDAMSTKAVALGAAIGSFLGNLAWSAVNKLASEIGEFVAQGAKLPAVESSFRRLSQGVKQDSDAMLASMTKGTKGLVSNFDLMQTANKAMLLGLPVTVDSMGDLSEAATKLGRAMGKDAKSSIDDLITALGRSSPMILDNLGLTVKVGEANEAYAVKLGKTSSQLTDAEKKTAFYEAAMEAARKKTAELGDQTLTLGEIAQSAWTKVGNVVTKAAADINVGIGAVLSKKSEFVQFLQDIVNAPGGADMSTRLALAVKMAADRARLEASKQQGKPLTPDQLAFDEAFNQKAALQALERDAKALTAALPPLTAKQLELATAFARGGASASEIVTKLNSVKATAGVTERQIQPLVDRFKDGQKAGDSYADVLKRIRDAQIQLTASQKTEIDQLSRLGISHSDIAKKLKVSEVAVKNYADEQKALLGIISQQIALLPRLKTEFQNLDLGMGMTPQLAHVPRSSLVSDLMAFNDREVARFLGNDTEIARAAIGAAKAAGNDAGKAMAVSWTTRFKDTMKEVLKGTGLDFVHHMSTALAEGISTGDWSKFTDSLQDAISNFLSSSIAGAIDFFVPGLGTALRPLFKALSDKLIGGIARLFGRGDDGDKERDAFLREMGGFEALARRLTAIGRGDLFDRLIRAGSGKAAERAIQAINDALGGMHDEMQRIAQDGGLASTALLRFIDATRDSAETIEFLKTQTRDAASAIGDFFKSSNVTTQSGATATTSLFAGAIAQMRAQGMSLRQILQELGPTIQEIQKKLAEAGFSGSDAFNQLAADAAVAAGEMTGPILDGIDALTRGLGAAHNAGLLNQEMFAGITTEILNGRQALLDQGTAADQANRLMQSGLQRIWELQHDFNFVVDEGTQAILDQAEAQGVVGDQFRSTLDRIAVATERMADTLERSFGKVGDAAEKAGDRIDGAFRPRTVDIGFRVGETPDVGGEIADTAATGGLVTARGIAKSRPIYAALGTVIGSIFKPKGTDTVPAMLSVGEGVLNRRAVDLIGANTVHALNAGQMPMPATAPQASGDVHLSVSVDARGARIDSGERVDQLADKLAIGIAKKINEGGLARTLWTREVRAMARPALGVA